MLCHCVLGWALAGLDLTAAEGRPIVQLLAGMSSALQFTLDHPLVHVEEMGITSAAFCAIVLSVVFGKDEADVFEFNQTLIDDVVISQNEWVSGALVPIQLLLDSYYLRPLVYLCISGALFSPKCLLTVTVGN